MPKGLLIGTGDACEMAERLDREPEKGECRIALFSMLDRAILRDILKKWDCEARDCLCIVETREAAQAAQSMGMPCTAYLNPRLPEQDFAGIDLLLEGFEEVDWNLLKNTYARALGLPVKIAETERLLIREMSLVDLEALYKLYEEPSARRFVKGLDEDREAERERTRAYIRYMYGLYQFGMWVVTEKDSGAVIGRVGFGIADYRGRQELDFGYLIGSGWQGRGLAVEACQAALSYGRDVLGFSEVAAFIHPANKASVGLIKKLGFEEQGELQRDGEALLCYGKNL